MALVKLQGGMILRVLGALKPTAAEREYFRAKGLFSSFHAVDPSTWTECDLSDLGSPIRDQGTHGSCTGHAGVAALDIVRRQNGDTPILLSCTFPYSIVNGGRDNGASVSSILKVLEQTGTCTFAECGTNQIFQNQYAQSCFDTAKSYKAVQAVTIQSFEDLCQAVNNGFPVAFGIEVGANFSQLDSEGVCPPPRMTIGGHALCAIGLKKGSRGDWLVKFQNSWTDKWGLKGYAFLSRGSFDNILDAYAIMYATNTDPPPLPAKEVKKLEIQVRPAIEPIVVSKEDSLTANFNVSSATGSTVHTDPDSITVDVPKKRKRRSQSGE